MTEEMYQCNIVETYSIPSLNEKIAEQQEYPKGNNHPCILTINH